MGIFLNGSTTNPIRVVFNGNDNVNRVIFRHNNVDTVVWEKKLPDTNAQGATNEAAYLFNTTAWVPGTGYQGIGTKTAIDDKYYYTTRAENIALNVDFNAGGYHFSLGSAYAGATVTWTISARFSDSSYSARWGGAGHETPGQDLWTLTSTADSNGDVVFIMLYNSLSNIYAAYGSNDIVLKNGVPYETTSDAPDYITGITTYVVCSITATKNGHTASGSVSYSQIPATFTIPLHED